MKQFITIFIVLFFQFSFSQSNSEYRTGDIADSIEDIKIKIYPNPFSDFVSIDTNGYEYDPLLYTITGKQVEISYNSYGNIDTKELASGVYVLILNMGNFEKSFKIVKE